MISFLADPAGSNVCVDNLENAKLLCLELGVPPAPMKTIQPSVLKWISKCPGKIGNFYL